MSIDAWATDEVPLDLPSAARIYDYLLGGHHNFEIDRIYAERAVKVYPDARLSAQANRGFLRRVVTFLVEQGIDQFLDIGSGIPTVGNVHEVAQQANPAARVVYADIDPIAVTHSLTMLKDNPNAATIRADARRPADILAHAEVNRLIDFSRPVGLLLIAILHLIADDDEASLVVRGLGGALVPGSFMAIGHSTYYKAPLDSARQLEVLSARSATPTKHRHLEEILKFFDGFELVEPGLVHVPLWRPESSDDPLFDHPGRSMNLGGVGRKL